MDDIPKNIKSGINGDLNNLEKEELNINVTSCILSFMEYAMKTAEMYVIHSNRKIITSKDIKKAMMLEVFLYFDRINLNYTVEKWRNTILNELENNESYTSESEEEYEEENTEEMINVKICDCDVCKHMNEIEEKWKIYEPSDELGKIFKNNIDRI